MSDDPTLRKLVDRVVATEVACSGCTDLFCVAVRALRDYVKEHPEPAQPDAADAFRERAARGGPWPTSILATSHEQPDAATGARGVCERCGSEPLAALRYMAERDAARADLAAARAEVAALDQSYLPLVAAANEASASWHTGDNVRMDEAIRDIDTALRVLDAAPPIAVLAASPSPPAPADAETEQADVVADIVAALIEHAKQWHADESEEVREVGHGIDYAASWLEARERERLCEAAARRAREGK